MDELSYEPGAPNVLSMTKRVESFARTDDGDEGASAMPSWRTRSRTQRSPSRCSRAGRWALWG